jgi:predicted ArsR family transcriptional regulator
MEPDLKPMPMVQQSAQEMQDKLGIKKETVLEHLDKSKKNI